MDTDPAGEPMFMRFCPCGTVNYKGNKQPKTIDHLANVSIPRDGPAPKLDTVK